VIEKQEHAPEGVGKDGPLDTLALLLKLVKQRLTGNAIGAEAIWESVFECGPVEKDDGGFEDLDFHPKVRPAIASHAVRSVAFPAAIAGGATSGSVRLGHLLK
jgi:hypothetical protein